MSDNEGIVEGLLDVLPKNKVLVGVGVSVAIDMCNIIRVQRNRGGGG